MEIAQQGLREASDQSPTYSYGCMAKRSCHVIPLTGQNENDEDDDGPPMRDPTGVQIDLLGHNVNSSQVSLVTARPNRWSKSHRMCHGELILYMLLPLSVACPSCWFSVSLEIPSLYWSDFCDARRDPRSYSRLRK